jgi:ribosomal protein L37AE/L43A
MQMQQSDVTLHLNNRRITMQQVKQYQPVCMQCGEHYTLARMKLGYAFCLDCGDEIAKLRKFTIAPLNKSNYVCITDITMLKQLNPKRTT